jgi:hypothetical protein
MRNCAARRHCGADPLAGRMDSPLRKDQQNQTPVVNAVCLPANDQAAGFVCREWIRKVDKPAQSKQKKQNFMVAIYLFF